MVRPTSLDPYPYDAIIYPPGYPDSGIGLLLMEDEQGSLLTQEKVQPVNPAPPEWGYGAQSPFVEQSALLSDWALGGGQREQDDGPLQRYFYAVNVDASVSGQAMKGMDLTTITPTGSTGPVTGFAEHIVAGTRRLVALSGMKAIVRTGDAVGDWQTAFTHTANLLSARRYKHAGLSAPDGLYIAVDTGNYIRYNGTAIVEAPIAMGVPAQSLEVHRENLWVTNLSKARKVNGDPAVGANYTAEIQVGDDSANITALAIAGDVLYLFKPNGVYGLNSDGTSRDLYPGLRLTNDARAGKGATTLPGYIYANLGRSVSLIEGATGSLEFIGPDRLVENTSEVQGEVMALCFYRNWQMFALLYNSANGATYLCKYGAWLNPDETNSANWQFAQVWHLGVRKISGKQGISMAVSDVSGTPRLYIGWSDGSLSWGELPRNSPSPLSDTNCRYTTDDGFIYFPYWHGNWRVDTKDALGAAVSAQLLTPTAYAQFLMSADVTGLPIAISTTQNFDTTPGGRMDLGPGTYGRLFRAGLRLVNVANTETPVVSGAAIFFRVRPAMRLTIGARIRAMRGIFDRAMRPYTYAPAYIRDALRAATAEIEPVNLLLPDGRVVAAGINIYGEKFQSDRNGFGSEGWITELTAVEYSPLSPYGTVGRMSLKSVGELNTFTAGGLQAV